MRRIHHYIDGRSVPGYSGRTGSVFDPATGRIQAEVDLASTEEVDAAVAAAVSAASAWSATSLARRASVMFRFRELLDANRKELASIITAEHGKVLSDAIGEVARGLENVEAACGVAHLLRGEFSEQASTGVDVYSMRQPLGVVAGVTPFNFPAMVPLWMFPTAIACGNTFVLKPSEKVPSAALFLADLLRSSGAPDGVFNVVMGDAVAVDRLVAHPDVDAVTFVGSTPVARHVYRTGTANGKRVQALGGAKNHMVVLPDAPVDVAADAAVSAAYGSAGQRCMAVSVVVAVGTVGDQLVDAIGAQLPSVCVGPGTDPDADMGPLISAEHRDRVASYLDAAERDGATVVADGRALMEREGFFLGPSLVDHVTPAMSVYADEVFGPVLSIVRVDSFDEALELVNRSEYGNGAAVFTRDGAAARRFQRECLAGMIGINVPIPVPVAYQSFGGWKASLFGDTHMYGAEGARFVTRAKVVTSRWPETSMSKLDLSFPGGDQDVPA